MFGLDIANSIVLVISILALAIFDTKKDKIIPILSNKKVATKFAIIGTASMLVLVFGIYGIGFEVNDFIYSRF